LSEHFIDSLDVHELSSQSTTISESISLSSDPTSFSISFDSILISVSDSSAFRDSTCFTGSGHPLSTIHFSGTHIFSHSQSLSRTDTFPSSLAFHSTNSLFPYIVSPSPTELTLISPTHNPDDPLQSGGSTPVIIGVTVGVLLLVAGIIIAIIITHRGQSSQSDDDCPVDATEMSVTDTHPTIREDDMGHEYDNPITVQQEGIGVGYTAANTVQFNQFE
jgi:hypothetical protein